MPLKKISRIENLITPHHTTVGPLLDTFWIHKGDIFWLRSLLFARGGWLLSGDEQWLANSSPILPVIGAKLLRFIPVFQPNWTRSWFISSFKLWPLRRNVRYHPKIPKVALFLESVKNNWRAPNKKLYSYLHKKIDDVFKPINSTFYWTGNLKPTVLQPVSKNARNLLVHF